MFVYYFSLPRINYFKFSHLNKLKALKDKTFFFLNEKIIFLTLSYKSIASKYNFFLKSLFPFSLISSEIKNFYPTSDIYLIFFV